MGDHKYIKCETSHNSSANGKEHVPHNGTNLSTYNYESAYWKNIKASLKKVNWPEILAKHKSSEEKLKVILEIVKIIEENCTMIRNQRRSHSNKIPRDRRVLFRKKKKLNKELQKGNSPEKKKKKKKKGNPPKKKKKKKKKKK